MEGEINGNLDNDPVVQGAVDGVAFGQGGRPMYESARGIADEEEDLRQKILLTRQSGMEIVLPLDLFPPDVFNPDGSRIMKDGRYLMTGSERRAFFELQDSRY